MEGEGVVHPCPLLRDDIVTLFPVFVPPRLDGVENEFDQATLTMNLTLSETLSKHQGGCYSSSYCFGVKRIWMSIGDNILHSSAYVDQ